MKSNLPNPMMIGVGGVLAAVCAIAPFLAFSALAQPHDLKTRLAAIDGQADRAAAILSAPGDPYAYAPGSVCIGPSEPAAQALKGRIEAVAAETKVAVSNLQLSARQADPARGASGVDLELDASGQYDAVVLMLGRLAALRPLIVVDAVDLQPRVSTVSLRLTGQILCATYARS